MNADRANRLRQRLAATVRDFVKEGDIPAAQEFAEIDDAFVEAMEIIESGWADTPTNVVRSLYVDGSAA